MTDPIALHAATSRAAQVKALVENDLLREAFAYLEQAYMDAWRSTGALETDKRERLFVAVNVIGKVHEHLQSVIANGRLAEAELEAIAEEAALRKRA